MRFDLVTIFPDFFRGPLDHGIVKRAQDSGLVQVHVQDLREFTHDRHRTVDDRPFGGGEGMVLKPEPLFEAVEHLLGRAADYAEGAGPERQATGSKPATAIVLLSASGKMFRQETARRFAQLDRIILLCGRYEGVDERVAEHLATDELSVGDFVLSGGELAAALVVDAVTRLIPGALGNEDSTANESFSACSGNLQVASGSEAVSSQVSAFSEATDFDRGFLPSPKSLVRNRGILDYPHYTRPADFRGWKVPDVLIGGNHAEVAKWRRKMALAKTLRNRPELLARPGAVGKDDEALMMELAEEERSK